MNVIVVNGSPKGENSNSMKLTRAFLEGAGWADVKVIDVSKADVHPCSGCYVCWKQTPGKCAIRDDMDNFLPMIVAADLIIWSFPLYCYSVPGKLKNLIDRCLPMAMPFMKKDSESGGHPGRFDLSRQRHVIVSTCGFWTTKGNYDGVTFMFDRLNKKYETIFCAQGELFRIPQLETLTDGYIETVRRAGSEYAGAGISRETRDGLSQQLLPRDVFEKGADASWGIARDEGSWPTDTAPPNDAPMYDALAAAAPLDGGLDFVTQMAALYKPDGKNRVLEFFYTDINKRYQILLTPNGSQVIDEGSPEDFRPYTTRIETPFSVWRSIALGEISGQDALMQGKYKVLGDFGLMIKWNDLFGDSASVKPAAENGSASGRERKTNMAVLLAPWIAVWVALAINPLWGGIAGVALATFVPLLWFYFKPVPFEQIGIPIVAGFSLATLLGADPRIVVSISYAAFGLMWLVGAFTKTPLTAYYSANNYGGDKAFEIPLFTRTNRILTAAWGVLYLVMLVLAYIIMGTSLSQFVGLVSSIPPVFMGLFTVWFQRWYPARWAKRGYRR